MKLDAVTVSVHESDSLALTLANRAQFDRWLIVTVPGDQATIRFCRDHGLPVHLSTTLRPDGADILAEANRARAMAEGVAALGHTRWVAMISSYVLLPRPFRAQLEAMPLDTQCRYRLAAMRPCTSRSVLERLKGCEPWRGDLGTAGDACFELADAAATPVRKARLPIVALLLGDSALHWGAGRLESERMAGQDERGAAPRDLLSRRADRPRLLVAGYYPGLNPQAWAPLCARVHLADDFGLARPSGDALAAAAAAHLRTLWRAETAELQMLAELDDGGDALADGSVDALYIPGEAGVERLANGLPLWRRTLKTDAVVCGDFYGWQHWPEASLAIAQLIGPPDAVAPGGFWHKRIDPQLLPLGANVPSPCVVLENPPGGDLERVLVSLRAIRLHWNGRLIVADPQADPALRAACACYGAELQRTAAAPAPSITLVAGTLPVQPLAPLFAVRWMRLTGPLRATMKSVVRSLRGRKTAAPAAVFAGARGRAWAIPVAKASTWKQGPGRALVRYGDDPKRRSACAHLLWDKMSSDRWAGPTPPIQVAADSTIVAILDQSWAHEAVLRVRSWTFAGDVPLVVAGTGAAEEELRATADFVALTPELAGDPRRLMRALLDRVRTERAILLPACAQPLPGASLFTAPAWSALPIVFHSTAEVKRINGAVPLPWNTEPLLMSAATGYLERLCEIDAELVPADDLATWLRKAVVRQGDGWEICNVETWGWWIRETAPSVGEEPE